jgi:hypothetical protein
MRTLQVLFLFAIVLTLPGCEAIATIFEAGVWVGVIGVLLVLGIIGFVLSRFRRR